MDENKKLLTTEDVKFLFNELRKASVKWKGRKEILRLCRKKVFVRYAEKGKAIYKNQWQCAVCLEWYKNEKELEVDHIIEIGGATGHAGDWNETIAKMFPRPVEDHLQVLCRLCHTKKTKKYNSARSLYERKRAPEDL